MKKKPSQVAIAIVYQKEGILCQLRDDVPNIIYPGHWGLFGGHLEKGETPQQALLRELVEEINYQISEVTQVKEFYLDVQEEIIRHVFAAPLTVSIEELILTEGQDLALLTREDIERGYAYSSKIKQERPLGKPHQHILLKFLASLTL